MKLLNELRNELKALMDKFIVIGYKLDFDIDKNFSDDSFAWISWATIDLTIADKIINDELKVPYAKYEKLICDLQKEIRMFNEFVKEIEEEYAYNKLHDKEYDYDEEKFKETNYYDKDDYCRVYYASKENNSDDSYDYVKSININKKDNSNNSGYDYVKNISSKKNTNNFWCY